jgi:hypothetical protein
MGFGNEIAFPFNTPSDILTSLGTTGAGAGGGGGGGSVILTTGVLPEPPGTPPLLPAGAGGSSFVAPMIDLEVAGGMSIATVPTLSGTLFGFSTLAINCVRID